MIDRSRLIADAHGRTIDDYYEGDLADVTDQIREVVELVGALYEENAVGGALHIVVDDWNIEVAHIQACREWIGTVTEYHAANLLERLSREGRATVLAIVHGFLPDRSYMLQCEDCGDALSFVSNTERAGFVKQHDDNTGHDRYRIWRDRSGV